MRSEISSLPTTPIKRYHPDPDAAKLRPLPRRSAPPVLARGPYADMPILPLGVFIVVAVCAVAWLLVLGWVVLR